MLRVYPQDTRRRYGCDENGPGGGVAFQVLLNYEATHRMSDQNRLSR